jgi:hypothetical protein
MFVLIATSRLYAQILPEHRCNKTSHESYKDYYKWYLNIDVTRPPMNPIRTITNGKTSLVASGLLTNRETPIRIAPAATVKATIFSSGENPHKLLKLLTFRPPVYGVDLLDIVETINLIILIDSGTFVFSIINQYTSKHQRQTHFLEKLMLLTLTIIPTHIDLIHQNFILSRNQITTSNSISVYFFTIVKKLCCHRQSRLVKSFYIDNLSKWNIDDSFGLERKG